MHESEADALDGVTSRLTGRFPELDDEAVASAVSEAAAQMTGPIRDYVPVLVEHNARDRLTKEAGHPPKPISSADLHQG
ncbi:three-helix bundle dimerization domain-containing protein [Sinomonas halotolerans]|uniref:Mutator family transposase n=1 Tax=Sinomonas halotolerans TaxID=1644133 RepID=A0ABU9X5M6_9MICC